MEGLPNMVSRNVLDFPLRRPELFSPEINARVLAAGEVGRVLYAAIRALPHVADAQSKQELQQALCELIFQDAA